MYKPKIYKNNFNKENPSILKKLLEDEIQKKNKILIREYFLKNKERIEKII